MSLFKKVACFTDIHFGLKSGSRIHNQDCEDFVAWFCETAKRENCETAIFLGDWHHNRSTLEPELRESVFYLGQSRFVLQRQT